MRSSKNITDCCDKYHHCPPVVEGKTLAPESREVTDSIPGVLFSAINSLQFLEEKGINRCLLASLLLN